MAESEFALVSDYLAAARDKPVSSAGLLINNNEINYMSVELAVLQRDETSLRQCAPMAEETAIRDEHILYQAAAHRAWGVLLHLQGEYEGAETRLKQALVLFEGLETRWQIGRTLYELGDLYRTMADAAKAQDCFYHALARFEEMGAAPDIARTQAALESFN